jgi:hypothetical protein
MEDKYWICTECGNKYGKANFTVTTFNDGKCDWCGKETSVCCARHYGWPKGNEDDRKND